MSESENIIKKNVLGSKNYFKNEIEGKEYSTLLKNRSRRRRASPVENEVQAFICPVCGSSEILIDYVRSEKTCRTCGLVLEENIIDSTVRGTSRDKEGNSYSQNGAPVNISLHDGGMATGFKVRGNLKNKDVWYRLWRLNNQTRVRGTRERNLSRAFTELSLLVSNLSLSKSVRNESASIYRKALDKDLIRGRSISKLMVATVYIACKSCRVPRTLDEMAEVTDVDKKTIGTNYRFLVRELGLKLPIVSPSDYIPRFASKLNLSSEVEVKSIELVNEAQELGLTSGKDPASFAAAGLYASSMILGERRTQTEIARALGVTEVTIRNRFKELNNALDLV
ncbi:MAG: TFIIB-type zinc ribbon-containing protein [Methanobrevibacter sp.]|nr:TFIIB-type zinc ribbon-containing protein [Methanobrevibacter sp.]